MLTGTVLLLDIGLYCLVKKLLNRLVFSKRSVTSLLFTSSDGINEILLQFGNVFKIVQYTSGAVLGSLGLFTRRLWHFNLKELLAFDISSIGAFKCV